MKKNLKKVFAAGLAATMVMGTASVAMANVYDKEGAPVIYPNPVEVTTEFTDVVSLDLSKTYKELNDQSSNPAENFQFEISCVGVTDSQIDKIPNDLIPSFTEPKDGTWTFDNVGEISFAEGEATVEGDTNSVKLYLPTYKYVGVYTYKIKELAGTTAGVTYDEKPLYLKVTVIEQNGKVRVAALHYETEDGDKTESFKNTYDAGSLTVSKTVTGNMGEKDRYFEVKVTLTGEEGVDYKDSYPITGGSYETNPETIVIGEETSIWVKNGDTITFENIPEGVTYTVVENDYTDEAEDEANKLGYDAAVYENSDDETVTDTGLGAIDTNDADDTVKITNNKGTLVDTGISLDALPYLMMLGMSGLGALGFAGKRRKEEDEI